MERAKGGHLEKGGEGLRDGEWTQQREGDVGLGGQMHVVSRA